MLKSNGYRRRTETIEFRNFKVLNNFSNNSGRGEMRIAWDEQTEKVQKCLILRRSDTQVLD